MVKAMGKKVLLVEDEVLIRKHIGAMIKRLGYTIVGETGTGEEAIALVGSLNPDIVVMDVRLAGTMSGIEAADQICRRNPAPAILFASAFDLEDQIPEEVRACAVKYLHKPVTRRALDLALAG